MPFPVTFRMASWSGSLICRRTRTTPTRRTSNSSTICCRRCPKINCTDSSVPCRDHSFNTGAPSLKYRAATIRMFIAKDAHFGELLSKGLLAFVLRLTGALLAFVMQVVLARVMGVYEFGLFALALTIGMLVAA